MTDRSTQNSIQKKRTSSRNSGSAGSGTGTSPSSGPISEDAGRRARASVRGLVPFVENDGDCRADCLWRIVQRGRRSTAFAAAFLGDCLRDNGGIGAVVVQPAGS